MNFARSVPRLIDVKADPRLREFRIDLENLGECLFLFRQGILLVVGQCVVKINSREVVQIAYVLRILPAGFFHKLYGFRKPRNVPGKNLKEDTVTFVCLL
jgi:hypothetical protein